MNLMHDCEEVSRVLSEAQDRDLSTIEQMGLRVHLVMCESCRHVEEQFRILREAMRKLAGEPPAGRPDTP